MDRSSLDLLVDPHDASPLRLTVTCESSDGEVLTGRMESDSGRSYAISEGIPRFVADVDAGQTQTKDSFGFKWQQRNTFDSPAMIDNMRQWLAAKYGFGDAESMRGYFAGRRRILDAGCGAGYSSSTWLDQQWVQSAGDDGANSQPHWWGVDISQAVDVARSRLGCFPHTHYVQADLLSLPFNQGSFDTIFSEGVLHHTPSTKKALASVVALLEPGGEILFYVYRKKGPVREFSDDHIRLQLSSMSPEQAWQALRPLTALGQALAELKVEVDVPQDVPLLGIKAGRQDVQRLIYWNFAKMFWNERLTFEENHHINFDWYHPTYAHRQTEEEIRCWCRELSLEIVRFHEEESGYTVRAIKR